MATAPQYFPPQYPQYPPAPSPAPQMINVSAPPSVTVINTGQQAAPAPAAPQFVGVQAVGPRAAVLICRSCNASIRTRIERKVRGKAHLSCLLCFLCGFWLCCFIPYCMDSCKNADHYCPNCNSYIGTYVS